MLKNFPVFYTVSALLGIKGAKLGQIICRTFKGEIDHGQTFMETI
jgi:hypothetical protein